MKIIVLNISLLLLIFTANTQGWKIFHRGRHTGGNVGVPNSSNLHSFLPPEEYFTQLLDHFRPSHNKTWLQRYYTNEDLFETGGPVFLMIGGEGPISPRWMSEGQWIEYAKQYKALCFQLEHRYYGKSHPTKDMSTKNLRYLNSEQALADIAYFISAISRRYELPSDTKWIVFGGSYPGSLAAWMREKYPHLVHAAVSSSGPLLAEIDFKEYYIVVKDALATHSDNCVKAVQQGTKQVEILLKHMIGMRSVNKKFRLCDPIEEVINNAFDVSNLFEGLASNFAGVVQYNKDNRKNANITIDTVCDIMVNATLGTEMDRLAAVNSLLLDSSKEKCLDYRYNNMINEMRNTSWNSSTAEGGRQWTYQTCTEFGFYQTSSQNPEDNIFGKNFPVEFFVKQCEDIFGPRYSMDYLKAAANWTNTFYGALDISAPRTVFVHGSIDPWHALGITHSQRKESPAVYIEGTAHCANMYPARSSDLPQLQKAREYVGKLIGIWLQQSKNE